MPSDATSAEDLRDGPRTAGFRGSGGFHEDEGRAFAECETVAGGVERAGNAGGTECLQAIEAGENQLTERVVAAGKHAFRAAGADKVEGMADGVRTGRAGIRDDADRPAGAEGAGDIGHLPLCLIEFHPPCLETAAGGGGDGLLEIFLTDRHRGRGGADDYRDFPAGGNAGVGERLAGCQQGEPGAAVHAGLRFPGRLC